MSSFLALIVEDDAERAAALQECVESANFSVVVVRDGWTALMKLARILPDVVILKPILPVVSGPEVAAHIRGDGRHLRAKILMLSETPVAGRGRDLADEVLATPCDAQQLQRTLQRLQKADRARGQVQTAGHPPLSSATQIA